MSLLLELLAQTTKPAATPPPPSGFEAFFTQIFPFILLIGVFWWLLSRGRKKEQQKYELMLKALKRNDRVLTIGGIMGTVVDVRENEVVLKVDETSNVKMRFLRSAIKDVLTDGGGGAAESK